VAFSESLNTTRIQQDIFNFVATSAVLLIIHSCSDFYVSSPPVRHNYRRVLFVPPQYRYHSEDVHSGVQCKGFVSSVVSARIGEFVRRAASVRRSHDPEHGKLLLPQTKQRVLLIRCLKISRPNKRLEIYRNNSICLVSRAYSLDNQPRNSVKRLPQEGLDAALLEGLGA
jgi:hypothetical protein